MPGATQTMSAQSRLRSVRTTPNAYFNSPSRHTHTSTSTSHKQTAPCPCLWHEVEGAAHVMRTGRASVPDDEGGAHGWRNGMVAAAPSLKHLHAMHPEVTGNVKGRGVHAHLHGTCLRACKLRPQAQLGQAVKERPEPSRARKSTCPLASNPPSPPPPPTHKTRLQKRKGRARACSMGIDSGGRGSFRRAGGAGNCCAGPGAWPAKPE